MSRYKLLIVDDEDLALEGLANYVDWRQLGYEVVGLAHNRREALQILSEEEIDVILSDIELDPGDSGLDLLEEAQRLYPQLHSVILSAHNNFDYARRALHCQAFDFLTKPVQFSVLEDCFKRLWSQLEADAEKARQKAEYWRLKRSQLLNGLAKEAAEPCMLEEARKLGLELGRCLLFRLRVKRAEGSGASLEEQFQERLESWYGELRKTAQGAVDGGLQTHILGFVNSVSEYSFLCPSHSPAEDLLWAEKLGERLVERFGPELRVGLSLPFVGLAQLHQAYQQAGRALDYALLRQRRPLLSYAQVQELLCDSDLLSPELEQRIQEALTNKDIEGLRGLLDAELQRLSSNPEKINYLYVFGIEFQLLIDRYLTNYLPTAQSLNRHQHLRDFLLQDELPGIRRKLLDFLDELSPLILQARPNQGQTVSDIKQYLQEHYSEAISLQVLAQHFFLHPNYLSKLFLEKTGQNFVDYLSQLRIHHARRLLAETELKIYDIAPMVGYESSKYFSKLFKELVGLSPRDYREQLRQNGG